MGTYTAQWEDEENNRIVELTVCYRRTGSALAIEGITPASITFVDAESGEQVRKIDLHTHSGRQTLLRQFERKVGLQQLHDELSSNLSMTA